MQTYCGNRVYRVNLTRWRLKAINQEDAWLAAFFKQELHHAYTYVGRYAK
jgi:hypothetical protein